MAKNIVLIHGWGAETKKLVPLKKELEKSGWKVFLPKLPGFEIPAPETLWGLQEYANYVANEALVFFKGNRYFVFGHSFGGGIAIKIALSKKDKVRGVVLCATRGMSRANSVKRLVFFTIAKTGKVFLAAPVLAKNFRKLLYKAAHEHDYEKTHGIMKEVFKKIISEDLKPILSKIKLPVLIQWGKNDKVTPRADALLIKKMITNAKLIEYDNVGHRLPYEKDGIIAKAIDQWSKTLN